KERVENGVMAAAVAALLDHHDALRLRFSQQTDGWQQFNTETESATVFSLVDLSNEQEQSLRISRIATELQASLNLRTGPLMRVALFELGDNKEQLLLIVVHHLAVDGVSWSIILEDIARAYQQLKQGKAVSLPAKTTSYQQWAEQLVAYSKRGELN